ncbi:MAG: CoA ester lyase [Pseudomonadota bacterium]
MKPLPPWRSLMFVPANNKRFIESAPRRGADAIQLDLEDSIPPSAKADAREALAAAVSNLAGQGAELVIRVNRPLRLMLPDLEAAVLADVSALTIPKVEGPEILLEIDQVIGELEAERGLERGAIRLIAMIETAQGLLQATEIAHATPRLGALVIGPEDLSVSLGSSVETDILMAPAMTVLIAARAAGITPLGYPGSMANHTDLAAYRQWIERGRAMGFEGAFCVHPGQVPILNEVFGMSEAERSWAEAILNAATKHEEVGTGAFTFDGRMVDAPIIEKARRILAKAG